ncbi:MAG: AsmA-like C-terminal region-containing protein [Bacteroidales bacterium]
MKKFIKILGIVIIVVLGLMIALPFFFKGDIMRHTKFVLNEKLDATVEFTDVKLSLFRHFPNLSVSLRDLSVTGKEQFAEDTLVSFNSFDATVDLISLFGDNLDVRGVYLIEPRVHAKVATDSSVNWDIMEEKPDTEEEEIDTAETEMPFRISLKTFRITDGKIVYDDAVSDLYASLNDLNYDLDGDLGADSSSLNMNLDINSALVKIGAVNYVNNANVNFKSGIGANIEEGRYHFLDNTFRINELGLNFEGLVELMEDNRIGTDIRFSAGKTSFKALLSIIPAIYMRDFEKMETEGNFSFNGEVSGIYHEEIFPSLDMNLLVEDARFGYPDLPKEMTDINISLQTFLDGEDYDNSIINLENFQFNLADNPFQAAFKLTDPISDPHLIGELIGMIELSNFTDVIPMEDTELKGKIDSDVRIDGKMSMIEKENYSQFQSDGKVLVSDFFLSTPDMPASFTISKAEFLFSPQYLELRSFDSKFGNSDIHLNGKIDNYLSYMLEEGILRADFSVSSGYFNANEFLASEETETVDTAEGEELVLFEVPERVDFKLQSEFDKIIYDKMNFENSRGTILVKDQAVYLEDYNMNLFDGALMANGEYNTADIDNPYINFDLSLQSLKIDYALKSFSMLDSLAPVLRNTKGDISLDLEYMSDLQKNMQPDLSTINGYGQFRSKQLVFGGSQTLNALLSRLKLTKSEEQVLKSVKVDFQLKDGRLIVEPFDVNINDIDMNIAGSQGLDKTMDYTVKMKIPRGRLGDQAEKQINSLISNAIGKDLDLSASSDINVTSNITGTYSDPKFKFLFGEGEEAGSLKDQVKEKAREELDRRKEEAEDKVRDEASKKAAQIIREAEGRAEKIKAEARKAADKIREEADKKAEKVIKEAEGKNFLLKKAAEETAKKIRQEADKKANKLEEEAERRADKIVEGAKQKANEIEKEE